MDNKKVSDEFVTFINGNEVSGIAGFKQILESENEGRKTLFNESTGKWESSYSALYEKIEGLIGSATATGLAVSYQQQRERLRLPMLISTLVLIASLTVMIIFTWSTYRPASSWDDSVSTPFFKQYLLEDFHF